MNKVRLVAATGLPLSNAGYMVPIFEKGDGKCFEAGGRDFPPSVLDELVEEEAAMLFDPVLPKGSGFKIEDLRWSSDEADHYGFAAFVFFFSERAVASLGGKEEIEAICSKHKAVRATPRGAAAKEWGKYLFLLIARENLVSGFIPQVIHLCGNTIDRILAQRIQSRQRDSTHLVKGEEDDLAQLAQVMMNIADRQSLDEAIRYYGAMLRLSPLGKNFPVWLDLVLHRWEHPIQDVEYWKNLAAGVYDAAEQRAAMMSRAEQVAQLPALQERVASIEDQVAQLPALQYRVARNEGRISRVEYCVEQIKQEAGKVMVWSMKGTKTGQYPPFDKDVLDKILATQAVHRGYSPFDLQISQFLGKLTGSKNRPKKKELATTFWEN